MFQNFIYDLDGSKNGIMAFIHNTKSYLLNDKGGKLFRNFEALESKLYRDGISYHGYDIKYSLEGGKKIVDYEQSYFNYGDKILVCAPRIFGANSCSLYEQFSDWVVGIKYIVTNKSNTHTGDSKYEYAKLKELRTTLMQTLSTLALYPYYGITINKDKYGVVVNVINTTIKIHICTNNKVIDYNIQAKANNKRCLPFLKEMDKYGTLYMFATVDSNEADVESIKTYIENIEDAIIQYMNSVTNDELNIHTVDNIFKGYIIYDRKEAKINGSNSSKNKQE